MYVVCIYNLYTKFASELGGLYHLVHPAVSSHSELLLVNPLHTVHPIGFL